MALSPKDTSFGCPYLSQHYLPVTQSSIAGEMANASQVCVFPSPLSSCAQLPSLSLVHEEAPLAVMLQSSQDRILCFEKSL